MDKILVEIYLPVVDKQYDVFIPLTNKMYEIESLLTNALHDLTDGYFVPSADTVICDRISGEALDINQSPLELGLMNGSRLMLI